MTLTVLPEAHRPVEAPAPRRTPRLGSSPLRVLSWVFIAAIVLLVAYPMIGVLWRTFGPDGTPLPTEGLWDRLAPVLRDTAIVVAGSSALALVVGTLLAWVHERTDASLGWVGEFLPISMLLVPSIAGVIGWVVLFDPRVGYGNAALRWLLGLVGVHVTDGPVQIYSMPMIVVVSAVYLVPYVFLMVTSALQVLGSSAEEASRISGASARRTFWKVTLPSIAPALAGTAVVIVMRSLVTFAIIAVIGTRAGVRTIPVYIYQLMSSFPQQTALAVVLSIGLMVVILLLLFVQSKLIRPNRFAMIGGKSAPARRSQLGPWRPVVKLVTGGYLLLTSALPALAVLLLAVQPSWQASIHWNQLTLQNFRHIFGKGAGTSATALSNSLILAAVGGTIVVLVATVIVLAQRNGRLRAQRFSAGLMNLPAMIPHSLIGVAFIVAFSGQPFSLYGTVLLLLLAYIVMELPYASQTASSAVTSLGQELSEASRVSGGGELRTLARVQFPLLLPGLAAGWIVVFIHMMSEATASVLLAGINNPVIGPQLLSLVADGTYGQVSALAVVITVVSSVLVAGMLVLRRRSARRLQGR